MQYHSQIHHKLQDHCTGIALHSKLNHTHNKIPGVSGVEADRHTDTHTRSHTHILDQTHLE